MVMGWHRRFLRHGLQLMRALLLWSWGLQLGRLLSKWRAIEIIRVGHVEASWKVEIAFLGGAIFAVETFFAEGAGCANQEFDIAL